ncbi:claudin-3-like [Protopterus annectens]|uniref:claudin-3-like n=1 Tax=Protopterus annectens TaxID=7888 RepID=UPI001CFBBD99|nr:claudin-3-like [Protopterus annectens]
MSAGLEMLGLTLSIIGWLGAIVCCVVPMWRVTAFVGNNIVVAQVIWEGLWMNCVVQSTGQMQCKIYDSMLALPQDLQAARALTIIGIILAILAIFIAIVGAKCTNCVEDKTAKAKITIMAGVLILLSGVMELIPVCWSANTIVQDFYNPLVIEAQKRELGPSLYMGWAGAAILILGGALLCCSCPPKNEKYTSSRMGYIATRPTAPSSYSRKDYV